MLDKIRVAVQAVRELGLRRVSQYALYQAGLRSGYYRLRTPGRPYSAELAPVMHLELLTLPDQPSLRRCLAGRQDEVIARADEIAAYKMRLFGGDPVELQLRPRGKLTHWSRSKINAGDVKLIWEPARFGWVFDLGRAYLLSQDERYPAVFWTYLEEFQAANPLNFGVNWTSGQEIALRMISLAWAARMFQGSTHSSPQRMAKLAASLVDHARRIPPTLIYARAQNNNHLVSEAAGLFTAGVLLPGLLQAAQWKRLGWLWFNRALQTQIENDGEYIQHSTNYHRLMLQLGLLVNTLTRQTGEYLPSATMERLAAATRWLLGHFDLLSGRAANLGHNDGANPLPLALTDFEDYRPVLQAASLAFLGRPALPAGSWDEYAAWLGITASVFGAVHVNSPWRIDRSGEWASLRVRQYTSRPAHADQLHVDLWHGGKNILLDAGTYAYNVPPPWDNGLVHTGVHNTVTIDGQDQMQRGGRFLWLKWAQAEWDSANTIPGERLAAFHNGYARQGVTHWRSLEWLEAGVWKITDQILRVNPESSATHLAVIHWLLPDGDWDLLEKGLMLRLKDYEIALGLSWSEDGVSEVWSRVTRAGNVLKGPAGNVETLGWFSPTYGVRLPALSYQIGFSCTRPLIVATEIRIDQTH